MFTLRFDKELVPYWAELPKANEDPKIENEIVPRVRELGYLTKKDFLILCRWKSPRTRKHVENNDEDFIRVVTQIVLSTPNEQLRISALTLLKGVHWPTASAILHFCHADPYPILDVRALWSLGVAVPEPYDFGFWWAYTQYCRDLAGQIGVSMRVLDRALWQFSRHHQGNLKGEIL